MVKSALAAEKRQHIIETAYHLFKRDGFHATGIDKIILTAAVAKMTMYRNFPRKDDLIIEVLNWRRARFENQLDRLGEANAPTRNKIDAILDWHERWFSVPDFHGCLFQHALAEFGERSHPVFLAAMRQKLNFQQRLQNMLGQSMPADAARHSAIMLCILIEGSTTLAKLGQAKLAMDHARRMVRDLLETEVRR